MTASRTLHALFLALILGFAAATASADEPSFDAGICKPPISTCRMGPVPLEPGTSFGPIRPPGGCPANFECVCVPSHVGAKDCAAQVCVPGRSECKSACDCEPGLGCWNGQCIAGIAPVFCCDSGKCEPGAQCQHPNGKPDICADPMCRKRAARVAKAIERQVKRTNRCEVRTDCVEIGTSTRCGGTCGAYVNKEYAKDVQRFVHNLDAKVCSDFEKLGCPFVTPGCLATVPGCVEGRCVGIPVTPGPGPRPMPLPQRPEFGKRLELAPAR